MLTFIGVGPGDPELMTLKAVRLLCEADAVALSDRGAALRREDWEEAHARAAEQLLEWLDRYPRIAFPVLGDPGVYATSGYLYRRVRPCHPCAIVPGVPAMCAAAAALGVPLCEQGERLTVLDRMEEVLPEGNVVVMKADRGLDALRRAAGGRAAYAARNLGMEGEWTGPLAEVPEAGRGYFTTAILKDERSI